MYVAVVGPGEAAGAILDEAREVGELLAGAGAVIVCGGLSGVMEAACRGAHGAGGVTVGLLPGSDRAAANPYLTVAIATGLGELRNGLVVRAADAVIGLGGGFGTLSELALAARIGRPVILLGSWEVTAPDGGASELGTPARTPAEAVALAVAAAGR